jgi:hypothetical protein
MEQQMLTDHENGLWTVEDPTVTFFGLHVGTRSTIIKLPSGGLLVYSPIALTAELQAAVAIIGPVEHVVAPNLFHHLWAVAWVDAWGAKLHATPKLAKKRKDFPEFRSLEDRVDPDWGDVLDTHKFVGFDLLAETVFFHKPSKTLVTADLLENFLEVPDHWFTKTYLKMAGISGKPGVSKAMALGFGDKKGARRSVETMLDWGFDRMHVCHGSLIEADGTDILREAYSWLPSP